MDFNPAETSAFDRLLALALDEDLGATGDVTSRALIPPEMTGAAVLVARAGGVIAGLPAARRTFARVDPGLSFQHEVEDGTRVEAGARLATVRGRMTSILTAERTALNFVQRLSGVATQTRRHVDLVAGLPVKILDTRKTTPGWRLLEKYAVRQGGGHNHRMGLYDAILIKDNHLAALPIADWALRIEDAMRRARGFQPSVWVEIEVDNLDQFDIALDCRPDIILLDNMRPHEIREAVERRNAECDAESVHDQVSLEASGGITMDTVRAIAETGVDRISVGALTHSAPALDIALDYLA
jgi:nicotinate-nucleotide pyrophosphorylase (carboxylating)